MGINREIFYRLASNLPGERLEAAAALISEFSETQDSNERVYALKRLINGLASNRDGARVGFSIVLTEILRLLIKDSNYPSEVVKHANPEALVIDNYSPAQFIHDLQAILDSQIKNKTKGKYLRSYLFGMLFGLQSLINSEVLNAAEKDYCTLESVVTNLLDLAQMKSWISELAHFTIANLIKSHNLSEDVKFIPFIIRSLNKYGTLLSTDGLLIYLVIPPFLRSQMMSLAQIDADHAWKHGDPLAKGNGDLLMNAFKNSAFNQNSEADGDDDDQGEEVEAQDGKAAKQVLTNTKIQKGSWSSQIHPVWKQLFIELIHVSESETNSKNDKKRKKSKSSKQNAKSSSYEKITFKSFCSLFQSIYFTPSTSSERKFTGLQIVELLFIDEQINLPGNLVSDILGSATLKVIIDHICRKDRILYSMAHKVMDSIVTSSIEKHRRLEVIKALERQSVFFDRLTHTKSVHKLLVNISNPNEWIEIMTWVLEAEVALNKNLSLDVKRQKVSSDERAKLDIQIWIIDSFSTLVKSNKNLLSSALSGTKIADIEIDNTQKDQIVKLLNSQFQYLVNIIFFEKSTDESNDKALQIAKEKFQTNLGLLMDYNLNNADAVNWTSAVVQMISTDEISIKSPLEGELNEMKNWAIAALDNIESSETQTLSKSLELLISMALLELYGGDAESASVLMDLKTVYQDIFKPESDFNEQKSISEENIDETAIADETQYFDAPSHIVEDESFADKHIQEEDGDPVTDTLLDLLLTYITQKSILKKNIATKIWIALLDMGVGSFQLERLREILLSRENKAGMEKLFNVGLENYELEEGEDEEEDDEEEKVDKNDILKDINASDNEDTSTISSSDDENSNSIEENSDIVSIDEVQNDELKTKIEEVENSTTNALSNALRNKSLAPVEDSDHTNDHDGEDSDFSDISEESMSDEQMFALDTQLSAIFKQRRDALTQISGGSKQNKKNGNERKIEAQEARNLMSLVKSRVLDLLDLYVNRSQYQGTKSCLMVSMMCLETIDLTLDKIVATKARKVVKDASKICFKADDEEVFEWCIEYLNKIFELSDRSKSGLLNQSVSQTIIYIAKCVSYECFNQNLKVVIDSVKNAVNDEENIIDVQILRDFLGWLKSKENVFGSSSILKYKNDLETLIKSKSTVKIRRGKKSKNKNKKSKK